MSTVRSRGRLAARGRGRWLVDWTPNGLWRDLGGLAAVSRATGVEIVATTGLHRDAHDVADDPWRACSLDDLAELFATELTAAGGS